MYIKKRNMDDRYIAYILFKEGVSGQEIARIMKRSEQTISRWKRDGDWEQKATEDLMAMPNAREFYELVRRGNTFLDAYRLANFDRITAAKAEQARQQALNNARSKDHLRALGGQRGGGALAVPAEEMAMFKAINPGVTEAQIQAYYNKNRNR